MSLSFKVEKTWSLRDRDGILVSGKASGGTIASGARLHERGGTRSTTVKGVEFVRHDGSITVIVEKTATWITPGMVLT